MKSIHVAIGIAVASSPSLAVISPSPLEGWPVTVGSYHESAPALTDVDGDNRPDVIVVTWEGDLYVFDYRGRVLPGFPARISSSGKERSSPAVADINGDGNADVVVASADGSVYAVDRRGVNLPGWPKALGAGPLSGPALQDFTSYRGLEVFVSADKAVYGLHGDGTVIGGWPVSLEGTAATAPAVGDLDGDHKPEVVVAAGSRIYAFETHGTALTGWPTAVDGTVNGTPVLADANGDGRCEVLVGTAAGSAYVLEADGSPRPGWPVVLGSKPITASAAVGELDNSDRLNVVFVAGGSWITSSTLGVYNAAGKAYPGFPKQINHKIGAPPLIVDADGDGGSEILLTTYSGSVLAFERTGGVCAGYPCAFSGSGVSAPPACGDVDGDGFLDFVLVSQNGNLDVIGTHVPYDKEACPWPTAGGNPWRTYKYFASNVQNDTLTLKLRGGEVLIQWKASPRADRTGWVILRGTKNAGTGRIDYGVVTEIEDQPATSYSYRDSSLQEGVLYYYKLEEHYASNTANTYGPKTIRAVGTSSAKPVTSISRCYPNPFSSVVNVALEVNGAPGETVETTLAVYDISGKLVRTIAVDKRTPGEYLLEWDGNDGGGSPVASGVYIISLRSGKNTSPSTKTVVLVR